MIGWMTVPSSSHTAHRVRAGQVGVAVTVAVGVAVDVDVGVDVGTSVGVDVGVDVGTRVGVDVEAKDTLTRITSPVRVAMMTLMVAPYLSASRTSSRAMRETLIQLAGRFSQ